MLCLLLAVVISGPAIAETPEVQVTEVGWIEINQVIHDGGAPRLQQVIIWNVWYDKHDRRWHYRPAWKNWSQVSAIATADGIAIYDHYSDRVWTAKRYCYSVTTYDPERECRTEEAW